MELHLKFHSMFYAICIENFSNILSYNLSNDETLAVLWMQNLIETWRVLKAQF